MSPIVSGGGGGGGGSQTVTESANYSGDDVIIADNDGAAMLWNILDLGTDVLDRSVPTLPVARKAGLFIVTAEVRPISFTTGGLLEADLTFDYNGDSPLISAGSVAGAGDAPRLVISGSYVLAAGDAISLFVSNLDGAQTRTFNIKNAFVSRIGPA